MCATRSVPMVYNGTTAFPLNFGSINVPIIGFMPSSTPKNLFFIIAGPGQVRPLLWALHYCFSVAKLVVCCHLTRVFSPSGRL